MCATPEKKKAKAPPAHQHTPPPSTPPPPRPLPPSAAPRHHPRALLASSAAPRRATRLLGGAGRWAGRRPGREGHATWDREPTLGPGCRGPALTMAADTHGALSQPTPAALPGATSAVRSAPWAVVYSKMWQAYSACWDRLRLIAVLMRG